MNATMSSEETKHQPVMLDQVLSIISPQHGGTFIDCTFGGGGYSNAILKHSNTKVFAIDRDDSVKKYANNLVKKFPNRFNFIQDKFSNLSKISNSNFQAAEAVVSRDSILSTKQAPVLEILPATKEGEIPSVPTSVNVSVTFPESPGIHSLVEEKLDSKI